MIYSLLIFGFAITVGTNGQETEGGWGPWSEFSECSANCGLGTNFRSRECTENMDYDLQPDCEGAFYEMQYCWVESCVKLGTWSTWSQWSNCSASCGSGTSSRSRQCLDSTKRPNPLLKCNGSAVETKNCSSRCPINGGWSPWSNYSSCSVSCGPGSQARNRSCDQPSPKDGGKNCTGNFTEVSNCLVIKCPLHGGWSPWSNYSSCSATCGPGSKSRNRSCDQPSPKNGGKFCKGNMTEISNCLEANCSSYGVWSSWSNYSSCSVSCGPGSKSRNRSCDQPSPKDAEINCKGNSTEISNCLVINCPTHGGWSPWSNYSSCSATCGPGSQARNRSCDQPSPKDGGTDCKGNSTEKSNCLVINCPTHGGWSPWSNYSSCSATCGPGSQARNRSCDQPSPKDGGKNCTGNFTEVSNCLAIKCPLQVDCTVNNGGCEHFCETHNSVSKCSCDSGFVLRPDNETCEDIDECRTENSCEGLCINSEGSYMCLCRDADSFWDMERLICAKNIEE